MTKLLIGMSLVLSVNSAFAAKEITEQIGSMEVVTQNVVDPIIFEVDSFKNKAPGKESSVEYSFKLFSRGILRLEFDWWNSNYEYRNSKGQLKARVDMSRFEMVSLSSALRLISEDCPAKIEVERSTLKIRKITKTCDDMAAVDVEDNAG